MRGSLFVLNVRFLRPCYATVCKLWSQYVLAASVSSPGASPVPVHSADELETGDFLISQVSDNLQHFSTVAIKTENLQVQKAWSVNSVLKEQGASGNAGKKPFSILGVLQKMPFHII